MSSVFISYSANDEDGATARLLARELGSRRLSVFFDRAIAAGEDFSHAMREALLSADVIVVLLSSRSQRSRWVNHEVETALESRKTIIPVFLDAGGKENWIWPLLSDRQARTVASEADVRQLAR